MSSSIKNKTVIGESGRDLNTMTTIRRHNNNYLLLLYYTIAAETMRLNNNFRHLSEQYMLVKRVTELKRQTTSHPHAFFSFVVSRTLVVFAAFSRHHRVSFSLCKMIRPCVWAIGLCGLYGSFAGAVVAKSVNGSSNLRNGIDATTSLRNSLETSQSRVNQVDGPLRSDGYRGGSASDNHVSGKGKCRVFKSF